MHRRKFLKNSALVSTGILAVPSFLQAGMADGVIIGHNQKRYKVDTRWGALDAARYPVKDCHEMVQDKKGRLILLTNETRNNVIIYNRKGKLLKTWGHEYPGGHGLTLFDENGTEVLFICDNNRHQVIKTDLEGRVLMTLDYPAATGQYEKAEQYVPTETAIAPNGDIYVADGYGRDFVIQYDHKGNYIRHFGGRGEKDENLVNAHGICVDTRDKNNPSLIVSSRVQNAFKRYSMDGRYLGTIPVPGAWVCRPVIKGDYLYAAVLKSSSQGDAKSGFITILDKNDKVVSNPGGTAPEYVNGKLNELSQTDKVFQYPHDVCVDDEDNIYVAQWNSGQVYPYKLIPV